MIRKINSVIAASEQNMIARVKCEKYFNELNELVELDVGSICCEGDDNVGNKNGSNNVLNLVGSRQKGVRNKRFKSIVEKKGDVITRRKSKKLSSNDVCVSKGSN